MEENNSFILNGFAGKTSRLDLKKIWRVFWHDAAFGEQCLCSLENHSKKKTVRYKERNELKRSLFLEQIRQYPIESLVFVDESGIDSYLHLPYGWSQRGEKVFGEISGRRFARDNFIAAKCKSKVLAPLCFQGTCNTKLFKLWVEQFLVPDLSPGQVVILDNASFHKSERTRVLIEQAGCKLLFFTAIQSCLNPIEKFWAWFKNKVRAVVEQFQTLGDRAIA